MIESTVAVISSGITIVSNPTVKGIISAGTGMCSVLGGLKTIKNRRKKKKIEEKKKKRDKKIDKIILEKELKEAEESNKKMMKRQRMEIVFNLLKNLLKKRKIFLSKCFRIESLLSSNSRIEMKYDSDDDEYINNHNGWLNLNGRWLEEKNTREAVIIIQKMVRGWIQYIRYNKIIYVAKCLEKGIYVRNYFSYIGIQGKSHGLFFDICPLPTLRNPKRLKEELNKKFEDIRHNNYKNIEKMMNISPMVNGDNNRYHFRSFKDLYELITRHVGAILSVNYYTDSDNEEEGVVNYSYLKSSDLQRQVGLARKLLFKREKLLVKIRKKRSSIMIQKIFRGWIQRKRIKKRKKLHEWINRQIDSDVIRLFDSN